MPHFKISSYCSLLLVSIIIPCTWPEHFILGINAPINYYYSMEREKISCTRQEEVDYTVSGMLLVLVPTFSEPIV